MAKLILGVAGSDDGPVYMEAPPSTAANYRRLTVTEG
jgi:hypothetical protein